MKINKIISGLMALLVATSTATGIADRYVDIQLSNPITASAETIGWHYDHGWWYVTDTNGNYIRNQWKKIDGKWYYFDSVGYILQGEELFYKSKYYYLNEDGSMAQGWKKLNGKWYYYNTAPDTGEKLYGWQKIGGRWYCLGGSYYEDRVPHEYNNGEMLQNRKAMRGGNLYYFGYDGSMFVNQDFSAYGKKYHAYADGHLAVGRVIINGERREYNKYGEFVRYW